MGKTGSSLVSQRVMWGLSLQPQPELLTSAVFPLTDCDNEHAGKLHLNVITATGAPHTTSLCCRTAGAHCSSTLLEGYKLEILLRPCPVIQTRRHGDELSISMLHAVMHTLQHAAAGVRRSHFTAINMTNVKVDGMSVIGNQPRKSSLD